MAPEMVCSKIGPVRASIALPATLGSVAPNPHRVIRSAAGSEADPRSFPLKSSSVHMSVIAGAAIVLPSLVEKERAQVCHVAVRIRPVQDIVLKPHRKRPIDESPVDRAFKSVLDP